MQKLHLVGFTANFDGLIFSARKGAKSGSFVVPIDGRLLKQLAEAERRRDGGAAPKVEEHRLNSPRLVRPESALSPREMQDRIRSGWTLEEVAAEAGVDDDWVRRFAAPVLAEVRQVLERARAAVYDKPRVGLSTLPLGASVRRNVLERGVRVAEEELDDAWSAYQLDDGLWIVRFTYTSRGRLQEAEWLFDLESEELTSRNRLASQLGHVVRGRARRTAEPVSTVPKPTRKAAAAAPVTPPSARRVSARKTRAPKKAAPKEAAPKKLAKKAAPKEAAPKKLAKKAAPKKAAPKKLAKKAAPKKAAPKKAASRRTPAATPAAKKVTAKRAPAKRPARKAAGPATRRTPLQQRTAPSRPPAPAAASVPTRAAARRPSTNGAAARRPTAAARTPAPPRKKATSPPAKKPAKEPAPAQALVEIRPERVSRVLSAPSAPPVAVRPREWPTDPELRAWTPPEPVGPLPPPPPAPVPEAVREAVATPIGDELAPPVPGATEVDPVSRIARIDSRRTSHYVSGPDASQPVFRGDVARAGAPPEPPGPRRPRRSEPLRGR